MSIVNIHLGLHKTASTYVQSVLRLHKTELSESKIKHFDAHNYRTGITRLSKGQEAPRFSMEIKEAIEGGNLIMIAEENLMGRLGECYREKVFYPNAQTNITNLVLKLQELGAKVINLFICLRSYDSFYPSLFSEYLRHNPYIPFKTYLEDEVMQAHSWKQQMESLSKIPHINSINAWEFEQFFNNKEKVINALIGNDNIIKNWEVEVTHGNKRASFSEKTIEILETIRKVEGLTDVERTRLSNAVDEVFPKSKENKVIQPFDDTELSFLRQKYQQDIEDLKADYNFLT